MVKQLYALEDRLFYASRCSGPSLGRRLAVWSHRAGAAGDFLSSGVVRRMMTAVRVPFGP